MWDVSKEKLKFLNKRLWHNYVVKRSVMKQDICRSNPGIIDWNNKLLIKKSKKRLHFVHISETQSALYFAAEFCCNLWSCQLLQHTFRPTETPFRLNVGILKG